MALLENSGNFTENANENNNENNKIAPEGVELKPVDARVQVSISSDMLNAYVYIDPPDNGGDIATAAKILEALNAKNVIFGIDMKVIEQMERDPVYFHDTLVASGIVPINGENAEIKFLIDLTDEIKPKEKEDGSVDFHDLSIIQSVSAEQVLCLKIPATAGIEGKAVTGKVLNPVKGKDAPIPAGKNTIVSGDKLELRAGVDGQVSYSGGRINVLQSFEVKGNVDIATGDIKFVGNVIVKGNVASGFTVQAGGNIEVWGAVEAATIRANGNITIHDGINGMGKAMIECHGDLNSKYIENANAIVFGSIKTGTILNSTIKCGQVIELFGRHATLMGGDYVAGKGIIARNIGSHTYISTKLEVGTDPTIVIRQKELENELCRLEKECEKVNKLIQLLQQFEAANRLDDEKSEMLDKARTTKPILDNQYQLAGKELVEIKEKIRTAGYGKVTCSSQMYPGTQVKMGYANLIVNSIYKSCTLVRDGDAILIK